jgi:hypothetical protein
VLSSAISVETGRSPANRTRARRDNIRAGVSALGTGGVAMRFVLANSSLHENVPSGVAAHRAREFAWARAESLARGDMVFLNMTESFHLCAWKKLLWYEHAARAFPTAQFFGIADDDAFVQLPRLAADLRAVADAGGVAPAARPYVYWGLIQWKPSYDKVTYEPSPRFAGWNYFDDGAAALRERFDNCLAARHGNATEARQRRACAKVVKGDGKALERLERMDEAPPFPVANGPLFVVSRALGELLVRHEYPKAWLRGLEQTEVHASATGCVPRFLLCSAVPARQVLQFYWRKGRVPHVLRRAACFPASFDAVLAWWVLRVAAAARVRVTLVNTPFLVQHHPWFAPRHGA